jgi:hypothetical protein
MRASWLGRLATATFVSACTAVCAGSYQPQQEAGEAASDESRPANQPLPRSAPLSLEDRARWRAALDWPLSCEEAFESSHAGTDGGLVIHALAPQVALVQVLCAAGTYQPSHVYVRYDERGVSPIATLLEFPVLLSAEEVTSTETLETEMWGEPTLSSDGQVLSVLGFSRQMADCGMWSRYALDAARPRLVAAAQQPCPTTPGPPAESSDGSAPKGWRPLPLSK